MAQGRSEHTPFKGCTLNNGRKFNFRVNLLIMMKINNFFLSLLNYGKKISTETQPPI